jgi:cell division protein FtsL
MKKLLLLSATVCLLPTAGLLGQEEARVSPEQAWKNELREIEIQNKRLSLQSRVDKINFERQMRELDLEKRRVEIEQARVGQKSKHVMGGCHKDAMLPFVLVCLVIHILLTIWVYQDIRKRNVGSGLWIAVTLLAGLLGAALYALVRIGDKPT